MAEILKIKTGEEPSIYTNHVLVEQTGEATFRGTGASNINSAPDHFSPPQMRELAAMLKVASAWADSHGIHIVHVKMQVVH